MCLPHIAAIRCMQFAMITVGMCRKNNVLACRVSVRNLVYEKPRPACAGIMAAMSRTHTILPLARKSILARRFHPSNDELALCVGHLLLKILVLFFDVPQLVP